MINFMNKPTLTEKTGRVVLWPFQSEDISTMLDILSLPGVNNLTSSVDEFTHEKVVMPADEREKTIAWYQTRNQQNDHMDLAIVYSNVLVGEVVLNNYEAKAESCNIRILIADSHTNLGIGSVALSLMIDAAFNRLTSKMITLDVASFNPRARHVYEKLGFKPTAVLANDYTISGQRYDSTVMTVTPETFKPQFFKLKQSH